jgi:hypothetical protein
MTECYKSCFHFFADIQGWWSTGFSYGLWIAALVSSGFSVVPVASQTWKAYFGLSRSESPKVSHSCYVEHTVALSRNSLTTWLCKSYGL